MRSVYWLLGMGSCVLIGCAAAGGAPAGGGATAAAGAQVAGTPANYSNEQLVAFAALNVEIVRMQAQGRGDQAALAAAVQKSGLTTAQYNEIAARMKTDAALNARIQEVAQTSGNEAGPAQPQAGIPAASSGGSAPAAGAGPTAAAGQQSVVPQGLAGQYPLPREGGTSPAGVASQAALTGPGVGASAPSGPPEGGAAAVQASVGSGGSRQTFEQICSTCHDTAIATGPGHTRAGWQQVVDRMFGFGMSATDAQVKEVVDYLAANYPAR